MNLALDQVCGQLIVGGYDGPEPTASFLAALAQGHRGGAILFRRNLPTLEATYQACCRILSAAPSALPPILSVDQEGGRVRRLPPPALELPPMMQLASLDDPSLVERAAAATATELRALGFNLNFAPVLDVQTNPDNPVIGDRAFGTEPQDVARMAVAYLRGLRAGGVVGCGKHFPGHGDTSVDSHFALPTVGSSPERLHQRELVPFRAAIDDGIECLMTAHIVCSELDAEVPATLSFRIATDLLRSQMGFGGALFSDDLEMGAIAARWPVESAAVQAIRAGCDALLVCKSESEQELAHRALVNEAQRDPAFRARCEQACHRLVDLRRRHPPCPAPAVAQALAVFQTSATSRLRDEVNRRLLHRSPCEL